LRGDVVFKGLQVPAWNIDNPAAGDTVQVDVRGGIRIESFCFSDGASQGVDHPQLDQGVQGIVNRGQAEGRELGPDFIVDHLSGRMLVGVSQESTNGQPLRGYSQPGFSKDLGEMERVFHNERNKIIICNYSKLGMIITQRWEPGREKKTNRGWILDKHALLSPDSLTGFERSNKI
jgi:hypothetical protein